MIKQIIAAISFSFLTFALPTLAHADSVWDSFTGKVQSEWDKSWNGKTDLYVPLHTWHNRRTYDADKIAGFNENPWGLGFGKSYKDADGDWHGFYAMAFKDSHNKVEPMAGYGYTKNFTRNDFSAGIGYTVFVTARDDFSYIPIPFALPIVSLGYKDFTISGTYIPGKHNNGNVAFFWGTYSF